MSNLIMPTNQIDYNRLPCRTIQLLSVYILERRTIRDFLLGGEALAFVTEWESKLNKLNQYKSKVKELRLAGSLTMDQVKSALDNIRVLEKDYIKSRSAADLLFFTFEFFSEDRNPGNTGNLIPENNSFEEAPEIHRDLCDLLQDVNAGKMKRICWSMPRGHGKSMFLSNLWPIWSIVHRTETFILLLSESEGLAQKMMEWVRDQLAGNVKLREYFGEDISPDKRKGHKDNLESFDNGYTFVQAAGMGKRLRGARNPRGDRPSAVIADDMESQQSVNTLELREKSINWWNKVIQPIGGPDSKFIYMGTLVHPNSLLTHIARRADYKSRIVSAIKSYPDNMDLWEQFEEILRNQDDPDREHTALDFYDQNKEEMDKGAETLWSSRFSYVRLMMEKVAIGSRAFASEFLNIGHSDEDSIFKESSLIFFDDKDLFDKWNRPVKLSIYGFWDIAMGKNKRSDFNFVCIIGRDDRTGVIYVLDTWAKKSPAHEALEVAFQKIVQWKPKIFGVETVQSQHEFFRQLQVMVNKRGIYHTRIKAVMPRGKKEERIESMEPLFENGAIRVKRSQRILIDQLVHYPEADHDDGPDCLQAAVSLSGGTRRQRSFYRKPSGV